LFILLIVLPGACLLGQRVGGEAAAQRVGADTVRRVGDDAVGYDAVKGIIAAKCATCHRPGEAAPFALLTYADAAKRASFIKKVIESNYMPPWKADPHYREFANDRRLTAGERDLLIRWIDGGASRGSGGDVRRGVDGPVGGDTVRTNYGRAPDLRLRIDSPFLVPGDNAERFIVFKLPYELPEGENIEGIEFYCNNKKLIHHINYGFYDVPDTTIDIYGGSRYIDGDAQGPAIREYNRLKKNFTYYTGWVPGASYESYPAGFGWTLPRRGVVLLTVHYVALGADERSMVGVNLFFTRKPIRRPVRIISLGSSGIGEDAISPPLLIRAGHIDTFTLKVKTPKDQSLLYVMPHMHYIGKEFLAFAVTPGGDTIPLVHIPHWDFRWQELYRMKKPLRIPAGSVVHLIGVYDNTADNPANPNSPPRMIFSTGNMTSTNEMFTLILIYVNSEEGDDKE
jgi:hypothetical protein